MVPSGETAASVVSCISLTFKFSVQSEEISIALRCRWFLKAAFVWYQIWFRTLVHLSEAAADVQLCSPLYIGTSGSNFSTFWQSPKSIFLTFEHWIVVDAVQNNSMWLFEVLVKDTQCCFIRVFCSQDREKIGTDMGHQECKFVNIFKNLIHFKTLDETIFAMALPPRHLDSRKLRRFEFHFDGCISWLTVWHPEERLRELGSSKKKNSPDLWSIETTIAAFLATAVGKWPA